MAATSPTFEQLKQGAANTLALAHKVVAEISDHDTASGLAGEVRRGYHRVLQLLERARERVGGPDGQAR
jgi:hypothetical protein